MAPSKKAIDRAGTSLRDWYHATGKRPDNLEELLGTLIDYRASFGPALNSVQMGIRSRVRTVGAPVIVSQRLKRELTILDKLGRHPTMKLTRMADIGGCRAILPDNETVAEVVWRIQKSRLEIRDINDYVAKPKPTGYRAVHVIVKRQDRLVEIQLRTTRQHEWAALVERLSGMPQFAGLKDGLGPAAAAEFYEVASRTIALQERGEPVDNETRGELDEKREAFRKLLENV